MNGVKFPKGTYQHRSIVSEMTEVLAEAVEQTTLKELKKSSFFGLICDESCDVSNFKKLIIYVTYVHESGVAKTAFTDIITVNDGKADTILNALVEVVQNLNIDLSKIVGFGTDGAAVMTGCKGGVGVMLKKAGASYLTQIHCSAHRVSLALSQAAKEITEIYNLEIILGQLYRFFDNSPVRESVLRQIFEINDMHEIKLKEPKNVRWLSFYEAVDAIIKSYGSVVEALEHIAEKKNDINSIKAKGLLTKMKVYEFPYLLSIVLDILEPVKKLNTIFQQQNLIFSKIDSMVTSCIGVLEELLVENKTHENNFLNACETDENDHVKYQNIPLGAKKSGVKAKSDFISKVIENLRSRFPEESLSLLKAFDTIFNPQGYPLKKEELANYGESELKIIAEHYGSGEKALIIKDSLEKNFSHYKQLVFTFKGLSICDFTKKFIREYDNEFPEFVKLAKIAVVLPISSADAERGFSAMKRIKTASRNRISQEKLKVLMMLSLQGPELSDSDDIIKTAHNIFTNNKIRRGGSSKDNK